jgi:undecaprenyl-diphosphatase
MLQLLIVASVPGAIIGLAFEKQAETTFRSPLLIAIAMAVLAVLLWLFDKLSPQKRTMGEMTYWDALVIGFSQALAIIPGVSRSGATITMARAVGVERGDSANFSFLMATPIIAGAGLVEARKLIHEGLDWSVGLGFVSAAVFGLVAIAFLIRYVRTRDYVVFAVYRLLVAALVIAVFFARG